MARHRKVTSHLANLQASNAVARAEKGERGAREISLKRMVVLDLIDKLLAESLDLNIAFEERTAYADKNWKSAKKWSRRAKRVERAEKRVAAKAARRYRRSTTTESRTGTLTTVEES